MTLRQLSVWFGLKPDTISKGSASAKEKKLKKLTLFCDYHIENKKLIIDRVKIPEYTTAYDIVKEKLPLEWGYVVDPKTHEMSWQYTERVDTCMRVGKSIWSKYPEARQVSKETVVGYSCAARTELYGSAYKHEAGEKGNCYYVYLNQDESGLLSEAEMDIFQNCRTEAYQEIDARRFQLDEARIEGEITLEQWKKEMGEIDSMDAYQNMQELLYERLGYIPVKRTKIVPEEES